MVSNSSKIEEHVFSIELKSIECIKHLVLSDENEGSVLIEGFLGKLKALRFTEGIMLEIEGTNGCLRFDFDEEEWRVLLFKETSIKISKKEENSKV